MPVGVSAQFMMELHAWARLEKSDAAEDRKALDQKPAATQSKDQYSWIVYAGAYCSTRDCKQTD